MREKIERVLLNYGGLNLWDPNVRRSIIDDVLEATGNRDTGKSNSTLTSSNKRNVKDAPPAPMPIADNVPPSISASDADRNPPTRDIKNTPKKSPNKKGRGKNPTKTTPPSRKNPKRGTRKSRDKSSNELELMGNNRPPSNLNR